MSGGDVLKRELIDGAVITGRLLKSAIVSRGDNEAPVAKRLASDTDVKHMFPPAAQQK